MSGNSTGLKRGSASFNHLDDYTQNKFRIGSGQVSNQNNYPGAINNGGNFLQFTAQAKNRIYVQGVVKIANPGLILSWASPIDILEPTSASEMIVNNGMTPTLSLQPGVPVKLTIDFGSNYKAESIAANINYYPANQKYNYFVSLVSNLQGANQSQVVISFMYNNFAQLTTANIAAGNVGILTSLGIAPLTMFNDTVYIPIWGIIAPVK